MKVTSWACRQRLPGPPGGQGIERSLQGRHGHDGQPIGDVPGGLLAVDLGHEEERRPSSASPGELLADAPDGSDSARGVDGARPSHVATTREVLRGEFVDDGEGKHHAGARTADVLEREDDGELGAVVDADGDADVGNTGLIRLLGRHHFKVELLTVALDREGECGSDRHRTHGLHDVLGGTDGGAIDRDDLLTRVEYAERRGALDHRRDDDVFDEGLAQGVQCGRDRAGLAGGEENCVALLHFLRRLVIAVEQLAGKHGPVGIHPRGKRPEDREGASWLALLADGRHVERTGHGIGRGVGDFHEWHPVHIADGVEGRTGRQHDERHRK